MENNQTETCPECRGQAESFVLMCGPKQPGSEEIGCRGAVQACDFCGGLGIVEVAVAERYRKGRELASIRVRKLRLTQEQLARVLRVPGITNGEQVDTIEHGRGPIPEHYERELREFARDIKGR